MSRNARHRVLANGDKRVSLQCALRSTNSQLVKFLEETKLEVWGRMGTKGRTLIQTADSVLIT